MRSLTLLYNLLLIAIALAVIGALVYIPYVWTFVNGHIWEKCLGTAVALAEASLGVAILRGIDEDDYEDDDE